MGAMVSDHQPAADETIAAIPVFKTRAGTGCINWFHRDAARSNQHCLYCGEYMGPNSAAESDKEHLIGRNMVPAGLMGDPKSFNFIFRACRRCNSEKGQIEDHVSAVTLLTSPGREDSAIDAIARRKAERAFDRRARQPVGAVRNNITLTMGGTVSMNLVSPAQLDREQTILLAFRHVQGLFSLVTSSDPTRTETTRLLAAEHFGFFGCWPYRDWGNIQLLEISRRTHGLRRIAEITSADGFFRAALREVGRDFWFWALEWNQNFRLAGWIGQYDAPPELFKGLPKLAWQRFNAHTRMRIEVPLAEDAEDLLFDPVSDG